MKRLSLLLLGAAAVALMWTPGVAEAGKYARAAATSPCANGSCSTPAQAAAPTYAMATQAVTVKQRWKVSGRRYGVVSAPVQVQAVQPAYATPQAPYKQPPVQMAPAPVAPHIRQTSAVVEVTPAEQPAQAQPVASSDPYGFVAWLNQTRAAYGLGGVWYDETLSAWAASNSANGYGHGIRAGRRQNVGWGAAAQVWPMWIASQPHRVAILDPSITRAGIAYVNGIWTFNGD